MHSIIPKLWEDALIEQLMTPAWLRPYLPPPPHKRKRAWYAARDRDRRWRERRRELKLTTGGRCG